MIQPLRGSRRQQRKTPAAMGTFAGQAQALPRHGIRYVDEFRPPAHDWLQYRRQKRVVRASKHDLVRPVRQRGFEMLPRHFGKRCVVQIQCFDAGRPAWAGEDSYNFV